MNTAYALQSQLSADLIQKFHPLINEAMKERKTFEKLKEKAFEKFVAEENQKEQKEVDELVSYRYGAEKFE